MTLEGVFGVGAALLPSPGEEDGTAEFSGAGIPWDTESSVNSPFAPCPEQGITMRCQLPERAAPLILLMPDVCRYLLLAQHMHFQLTKDFHLM